MVWDEMNWCTLFKESKWYWNLVLVYLGIS